MDSGSAFTIINVKTYSKLNLPLSPFEVACFSATAEPVSILGAVTCKVKVDRYSWKHKFLVSDNVTSDIILGADFISKTKLLLQLSKREIFFSFEPNNRLRVYDSPKSKKIHKIQSNGGTTGLGSKDCLDLSYLGDKQKAIIKGLVKQYPQVFTSKLGLTSEIDYEIILEIHKPVRLPPYKLSPPKLKIMKDHIEKMLEDDIIRPSTSNYSSPIFLVPKGENEFRPVVDYRVLNSNIHIESTPLSVIHSCFHWFSNAQYTTTLDLNSAYH